LPFAGFGQGGLPQSLPDRHAHDEYGSAVLNLVPTGSKKR
jgi:hypothetical protein